MRVAEHWVAIAVQYGDLALFRQYHLLPAKGWEAVERDTALIEREAKLLELVINFHQLYGKYRGLPEQHTLNEITQVVETRYTNLIRGGCPQDLARTLTSL